jgi:Tetratricopeptide repeat.
VKTAEAIYPKRDAVALADAYFQLGNVEVDLGKWDEAINNYKNAFDVSNLSRGRDHKLTTKAETALLNTANAHGRSEEAKKFIEARKE